jgi:hypothetical protein
MKKLIALTVVAATLAGVSAFGQGYFVFGSGKSQVYDGSGASAVVDSAVTVALFWASGSSVVPTVSTFGAQSLASGNNTTLATTVGYTDAQAWTAILSGNFTEGVSAVAFTGPDQVNSTTKGAVSINSGITFDVTGTVSSGSYTAYLVSWTGGWATPAIAQANGAPVGWSTPYNFTAGNSVATLTTPTLNSFGTFAPLVVSTPEPGTLALAALGGAAMLFIRRKK